MIYSYCSLCASAGGGEWVAESQPQDAGCDVAPVLGLDLAPPCPPPPPTLLR